MEPDIIESPVLRYSLFVPAEDISEQILNIGPPAPGDCEH